MQEKFFVEGKLRTNATKKSENTLSQFFSWFRVIGCEGDRIGCSPGDHGPTIPWVFPNWQLLQPIV